MKIKKKLRVLFIVKERYPTYRVDVVELFENRLPRRGHQIDIVMQSEKRIKQSVTINNYNCRIYIGKNILVKYVWQKIIRRFLSISNDVIAILKTKNINYDLIIIRDKITTGLLLILLKRLIGSKICFWLSFPFPEYYFYMSRSNRAGNNWMMLFKGFFSNIILYRFILKNQDHIFVQTEYMKNKISSYGIKKKLMTPVLMGVSTENIPNYGYNNTSEYRSKDIVYLGSISKSRRIEFLIDVLDTIIKKHEDVFLIVIGAGEKPSDKRELIDYAEKKGVINNLILTGFLPQKEAWAIIDRAHVCLSPIFPSEVFKCGSPTKLIEYMAIGKATVANHHPEQIQVLSDSKAGICVPYNVKAFASAVIELLENKKLKFEMGKCGREYVSKYRDYKYITNIVEDKLIEIASQCR